MQKKRIYADAVSKKKRSRALSRDRDLGEGRQEDGVWCRGAFWKERFADSAVGEERRIEGVEKESWWGDWKGKSMRRKSLLLLCGKATDEAFVCTKGMELAIGINR